MHPIIQAEQEAEALRARGMAPVVAPHWLLRDVYQHCEQHMTSTCTLALQQGGVETRRTPCWWLPVECVEAIMRLRPTSHWILKHVPLETLVLAAGVVAASRENALAFEATVALMGIEQAAITFGSSK